MCTFKEFKCWYKNKDVVPTLEAMQKVVDFYHNKRVDLLNPGCTLPNLAFICLHRSTTAKFYPFTESYRALLEKRREDMVGGPSIVVTGKTVVDGSFLPDSTNWCKSIVGIHFSPVYPFTMCQATGMYTSWR